MIRNKRRRLFVSNQQNFQLKNGPGLLEKKRNHVYIPVDFVAFVCLWLKLELIRTQSFKKKK